MYELEWQETGCGEDFESWLPISECGDTLGFEELPPEGWPLPGQEDTWAYDIWFKAYDTSFGENEQDKEAFEAGCLFTCYVMIRGNDNGYLSDAVIPNPVSVRTREDAQEYFCEIRDRLVNGEIDLAWMCERGLGKH